MANPKSSPYGSWKSPITSELIVAGSIALGDLAIDGDDIYWTELRPTEKGRNVLVKRGADGQIQDVTPAGYNVRSRVHEYGGGAYLVHAGTVYFSNFQDQRLYCQPPGGNPFPLTPDTGDQRYADAVWDHLRHRLVCVHEDHRSGEVVNMLVSIASQADPKSKIISLVSGNDFYASPCISPDGNTLAWLTWNHPNMPWDGTELWIGTIQADGSLRDIQKIAGGEEESIFQPQWSPDGTLYFISDRTGWWNFYRYRQDHIQTLTAMEAEFGLPQWVFGLSTYGFASDNRIICACYQQGLWRLAQLDTHSRELTPIETPFTEISSVQVTSKFVLFKGSSPNQSTALIRLDLKTHDYSVLRRSSQVNIGWGYISTPQLIKFPTEKGLTAYGYFYPPQNQDFVGPLGTKPPLLVKSHGGPTAATSSSLNLKIQYWTSRGIAVLDVNYGGSTGYGRAYQLRLRGKWGVVDVDDCVNGARYLAEKGMVDSERMAITGSSAGGYTTLAALTFRNTFKAGASYYGIGDLTALARDTHKFEAHYLDRLIGPYPEQENLYRERSPFNAVEHLSCPVIFFQGLEDKVVPPNQAEAMVQALSAKGIPVAYITFPDEQHGFRQADNIRKALDSELYFYSKIFGFTVADEIEAVPIQNL